MPEEDPKGRKRGAGMIRDITIGQYYPAQSQVHRLDPRVKIVCTLAFLVSLFLQNSILGYVVAFAFLAMVIRLSKVPVKFIVRGLKPIVILLLFTVLMNLFLTRSGNILFHYGILTITEGGLRTCVFMTVRLIFLVMGSSIMTFTTTPNSLTDGIEKLLHPLNRIHVPVHEIAMMMSLALRFVPTLLEETDKITQAQKARGADMESGNIIQRVKAFIPILIPLFVSAFRRAYELATAMECRCYRGGTGRTRMKTIHMAKRDYVSFVMVALLIGGVILCNIFLPAAV